MTDVLGTAGEIAAALGATPQRVSGLGTRGLIGTHGAARGTRRLFALSEVAAYLAAHPDPPDATHLLSVHEIAERLGRSLNTVNGWVSEGALKVAGRKRNPYGRWVRAYREADARKLDAQAGRGTVPREHTLALPAQPTTARPGSESRIKVYESRVEAGFQVFHPQDTKLTDTEAA